MHPRVLYRALRELAPGARIDLAERDAHHMARVVRVEVGDPVVLFDGAGFEALATTVHVRARPGAEVAVQLGEAPHEGVRGDAAGVIWLQGMPKADKFERVVRQAAELGVSAIWPVYTARSVPRPRQSNKPNEHRGDRWRAIAESASAQCGRADVADVRDAHSLDDALQNLSLDAALRLLPWESGGTPVRDVLSAAPASRSCAVLVGPEGGLTEAEVLQAQRHGFVVVSLGPRILRTETVAPALLALLSYARGDLRNPAPR